jgi:hypothetical protein
LNPKQFGYSIQSMFRVKIERQKNKGGQRDLTGEDGSLANAGGADQEDSRSRLQRSLHGPAPKPCTLTPDQNLSGFLVFLAAEWELGSLETRRACKTNERRKTEV